MAHGACNYHRGEPQPQSHYEPVVKLAVSPIFKTSLSENYGVILVSGSLGSGRRVISILWVPRSTPRCLAVATRSDHAARGHHGGASPGDTRGALSLVSPAVGRRAR